MRQLVQIVFFLIFCSSLSRAQEPKIVGGYNVTNIEGFRHQVSLRLAQYETARFGAGHICGGSLITVSAVLTAAHCVFNDNTNQYYEESLYVVAMGMLLRFERDSNTLVYPVERIVGHANYNNRTFANDIAVLHLTQRVPSNHPTVSPINVSNQAPPVGQTCIISGWGSLAYEGLDPPNLMAANVTINSRADCNLPNRYNGLVLPEMFCAGPFAGGIDSCQGDSGGPLFCGNTLVGIVSNGFECARPNYPGIYIGVYHYRYWLLTGDANVTTSAPTTTVTQSSTPTLSTTPGASSTQSTTGDSSSIVGNSVTISLSVIAAITGHKIRL